MGGLFRQILLVISGLGALMAHAQNLTGVVFEDSNKNGVQDVGEPGCPDIVVSNQIEVTVTNEEGRYQLPESSGYGLVFISPPGDYGLKSASWMAVTAGKSHNFPLIRQPRPKSFTFIHATDTHLNETTLHRFHKFRDIVARRKPDFVLISGDLIKDALRVPEEVALKQYQRFLEEAAALAAPVRFVPGNHEIFGIERHKSLVSSQHPLYGRTMYRSLAGPDYYSFNFGDIHFIGLNSVDISDLWYYGNVDAAQLKWLEADLARVPQGTTVVTFNHIPFYSASLNVWGFTDEGPAPTLIKVGDKTQYRHLVGNAVETLSLFKNYNHTLALAGHFHIRESLMFQEAGVSTRFHQGAAVVGPVPMGQPKPSGVTLYRVKGNVVDDGEFIFLDP